MKNQNWIKTICLAGTLFGGVSSSFAKGLDGELNSLHITHCLTSTNKCFSVKAESGDSSIIQKIISLKNIQYTLDSKTSDAPKGYLDLESNNLVLLKRNNSGLQETVINLHDLKEQIYVY